MFIIKREGKTIASLFSQALAMNAPLDSDLGPGTVEYGLGQAFGTMVKTPLGVPLSHIRVPCLSLNFPSSFLLNVHLGKQWMMTQVLGFLPPMG